MPAVGPSPSRVGLKLSFSVRDFAMIRYRKEMRLGTNSASRPMHRLEMGPRADQLKKNLLVSLLVSPVLA
jgi:hypothetical protein